MNTKNKFNKYTMLKMSFKTINRIFFFFIIIKLILRIEKRYRKIVQIKKYVHL